MEVVADPEKPARKVRRKLNMSTGKSNQPIFETSRVQGAQEKRKFRTSGCGTAKKQKMDSEM